MASIRSRACRPHTVVIGVAVGTYCIAFDAAVTYEIIEPRL